MHGTRAQRHCRPHAEDMSFAPQRYWGWSHPNQRMEFMDLPTYVDSVQKGYNAAYGNLLTGMQQLGWPAAAVPGLASASQSPAASGSGPVPGWHGRHDDHGHHKHEARWGGHHGCEHRDDGCGCEHTRDRHGGCRHDRECDDCEHDHHWEHARCKEHDCRCDCCIVDADIIVFAHCGEVRVVPIEVANDSRKIRENVDVQVGEVRSGGGKVLAWQTLIRPEGPLTLEPCSKTRLELLVHVACGAEPGEASQAKSSTAKGAPSDPFAAIAAQGDLSSDVDRCEVGYTTIRLDGCLVRPIVVAIAALPLRCDSYRVGCSCCC
jgi:hypothetical protein